MTSRFALTLVAVLAFILGATSAPQAHPGHEQKVMGTVTMTAPDHVMLKNTDGQIAKVIELGPDPATKQRKRP